MQSDSTSEWEYPPEDFDYQLVRDGAVALFRKQAVLDEAIFWLKEHQYLIRIMDAVTWQDKADFHIAVAQALDFPYYYGQNLNALNDCLSDMDVPVPGGMAIVLLHYDAFNRIDSDYAQGALDILARACWFFLVDGRKLLILVQSDDPFVQLGPLGCRDAVWNRREWFSEDRV